MKIWYGHKCLWSDTIHIVVRYLDTYAHSRTIHKPSQSFSISRINKGEKTFSIGRKKKTEMEQEPFGQCDAKEICMHTHDQIHGKWSKLIQKSHNYNWYKRVVSEFINLLLNYSHTYHIFIHLPCAHQFKYLIVVQHLMLPFFFLLWYYFYLRELICRRLSIYIYVCVG